jgi:L-ascorbate metabolism protein UlaG (beta-lactamase superfamily)
MNLPHELRNQILGEASVLHHLNADSSWLLQIPYPHLSPNGRKFFNILLDPWLSGPQSDVASWFSKQWHAVAPAYGSIAAVEELCWGVERVVGSHDEVGVQLKVEAGEAVIDAVVIGHEFTDHCHEGTLRELDPKTAVFANAVGFASRQALT